MSKLLILPLVMLISCVSDNSKPTEDNVGQLVEFSPLTSYENNERIKVICQALTRKEDQINELANSGSKYTFSYTEKGCGVSEFPAAKDIVVKLVRLDPRPDSRWYAFKAISGEVFSFEDVELASQGALADLCNFGATLESPIKTSTGALWWTTYVDSKDCNSGFGNMCIYLQRGTSVDGRMYRIHTNEWIKFKVMGESDGFFLERKLVSTAGCSKGQELVRKAILK
jgi:hypothetical protein